MHPEEFLASAELCLANGASREGHRRSCISRAYYAAYSVLKEAVRTHLSLPLIQSSLGDKSAIAHIKLCGALKGSKDATLRDFGVRIDGLRLARITADYHLDHQVSQAKACNEYENAVDLISDMQSHGLNKIARTLEGELKAIHGDI